MKLISRLQDMPHTLRLTRAPNDLAFIDADTSGIVRTKTGDSFTYRYADTGHDVTDEDQARIKSLGIPPAWRNVWVCPAPNGYLQATGFDKAGRKQYRYHPDWRAYRERSKFHSLTDFGAKLPRVRRRVRRAFREHTRPDRQLVCAALVRLLDDAPLRIGNEAYSETAIGASTLRRRNVRFSGTTLYLDYTAKGGKRVRRQIKDSRLLSILEEIDDLPGRSLFQYVGVDGEVHQLRSEQVNAWLHEVTDNDQISAKTFRTWAGSLAAFKHAVSHETLTIKAMSNAAARTLRNTPSVAHNSYIHPAIINLKDQGYNQRKGLLSVVLDSARDLTRIETAMLRFLAKADGIKVS